MTTINLSKTLQLPAEIAGRRTAVFGISGSGKSNTAAVIVEQLLAAGEQCVLIDPKGEAWGLLSLANGKPSKLPLIIFGEPHGHIASLDESHGPRLADFVVDSGRSIALSLLGFESDQSERRFVSTFLRQLYRRKTKQNPRTRTLVILEEAHLFIPESVKGDAAELSGAMQRIVRQGRSFGLGSLLIDQRPADVSKRCVTQCDSLICHQLIHQTDRTALQDWVKAYDTEGYGEKFLKSLAALQSGEAWIWSPAWLKIFQQVKVHRRTTFDSGATPDDASTAAKVQRAEVDLDSLRGQLAEIVDKAKVDDPKELRRQIADLQKQLSDRPAVEPELVEVPVINPDVLDDFNTAINALGDAQRCIGRHVAELQSAAERFNSRVAPPTSSRTKPGITNGIIATQNSHPTHKPLPTKTNGRGNEDIPSLGKAERAILGALFWLRGEDATPAKVSFYSDYSANSSSFSNALGRLRSLGLAYGWQITAAGADLIGDAVGAKPSGTQLREWLRAKLGRAENSLLDVLVNHHPDRVDDETLSAGTGYSVGSSSFSNALGRLRSLEAAYGGRKEGGTKAADVFFK